MGDSERDEESVLSIPSLPLQLCNNVLPVEGFEELTISSSARSEGSISVSSIDDENPAFRCDPAPTDDPLGPPLQLDSSRNNIKLFALPDIGGGIRAVAAANAANTTPPALPAISVTKSMSPMSPDDTTEPDSPGRGGGYAKSPRNRRREGVCVVCNADASSQWYGHSSGTVCNRCYKRMQRAGSESPGVPDSPHSSSGSSPRSNALSPRPIGSPRPLVSPRSTSSPRSASPRVSGRRMCGDCGLSSGSSKWYRTATGYTCMSCYNRQRVEAHKNRRDLTCVICGTNESSGLWKGLSKNRPTCSSCYLTQTKSSQRSEKNRGQLL